MSELTQARLRAGVVAVAPIVVLFAFLYQPYIADFNDNAAFAGGVAADTTRWAWATTITAVGLALTALLIVSLRSYLRAAGEQLWSFIAVPLVVVGAVLIAYVTGVNLGLANAIEAGASGEAVLKAGEPWFFGTILPTTIIFGLGWLSLAAAVYKSEVLSRQLTWVVVGALVVLTVALFTTTGWGRYVIGVALIAASWPLAYQMWIETREAPMAGAQPSPE